MGELYNRFALFLQALIILFGVLFFTLAHPATAQYILQKAFESADVSLEKVEGSLLFGFSIYDMRYKKAIRIERIRIVYTVAELLSPAPSVKRVELYGLDIYPKMFEKESEAGQKEQSFIFVPVTIRNVEVSGGRIDLDQDVTFKADIEDIVISKDGVGIRVVSTEIESVYGLARIEGSLKEMRVEAKGRVLPKKEYYEILGRYVDNAPHTIPVRLFLDEKALKLSTSVTDPLRLHDTIASLSDLFVNVEYLLKENYLKASASYDIKTPFVRTHIKQSALVTLFGAYATKIEGKISNSAQDLPFEKFDIDAAGDLNVFMADIYAGPFLFSLFSEDYDNFAIEAVARPHRIDYIKQLPPVVSNQYISMEANATARLKPDLHINGVASFDGNYSYAKSYLELSKESLLLRSSLTPKKKRGGIWENIPERLRSRVDIFAYLSKEKKILNIIAKQAGMTLFERKGSIKGWANIGSLTLDADGRILDNGSVNLALDARIDSLYELLDDFNVTTESVIDAQIESRFLLSVGDTISLRYHAKIPWYLLETDSRHIYYGLDSKLEGSLRGNEITIDSYSVAFKNRRFDQNRRSVIALDGNSTVRIERLCLLDRLDLKGSFDFAKKEGEFHLFGDDAHYSAPEGDFTFDADIKANISPEKISAEGEIEVKDALVTYRPQKEYVVEDEDIVIIQDIKEPSRTKRAINIHIYSKRPLTYKIPELSAKFIPDITLWKEPGKPFGLLGVVKITEGEIDAADKHFTIRPSEIYFGGENPVNPYLDLHISYELDFYRFNIYISHTLAKPLFLFSSEPPMSQNDIMSYILFGAPAGEEFAASGEPGGSIATLLLGVGLKNAIGSATGIRFDTLNILSSESGGLGIEVGKRLGKRLRIIYRNDTVSSFIVRYKASRSIRIEIDVKETGQGVNILYVRDLGRVKEGEETAKRLPDKGE